MMKRVDVYQRPNGRTGWIVRVTTFETQAEAIEVARDVSKSIGGELLVHGEDGMIREKDSHGNDPKEIRG